ncbi:hypothetical protein SELMODRAFT_405268 [Selaginella moellendorffii]|uniref:Uncharacterized protein n=1 Tax=Selaginella moellendorffii TaxID=88036 RepID=D8QWT5_SELML|nr:hypothetical protein SELMODRAFT_405268 [Selaginella moellendorffii]
MPCLDLASRICLVAIIGHYGVAGTDKGQVQTCINFWFFQEVGWQTLIGLSKQDLYVFKCCHFATISYTKHTLDAAIKDTVNLKQLFQVAVVAVLCIQLQASYRPLIGDMVNSL